MPIRAAPVYLRVSIHLQNMSGMDGTRVPFHGGLPYMGGIVVWAAVCLEPGVGSMISGTLCLVFEALPFPPFPNKVLSITI